MVWTFIIQIAISLALTAISYAIRPRQKAATPQAAGLDDIEVPQAEEGGVIAVVFGTVLVRGVNVVWVGDLKTEPVVR